MICQLQCKITIHNHEHSMAEPPSTSTTESAQNTQSSQGPVSSQSAQVSQKSQDKQGRNRPRNRRPRRPQTEEDVRQKSRPAVAKPKPKSQDKLGKRTVEINQIKKGYPKFVESDNGLAYNLVLRPSDPDFPFDIEALRFTLFVPKDYPQSAPYISVKNTNIPRGYGANVESGFRDIALKNLGRMTLMNMTLQLDRRLEEFLSKEKQETIKLIRGKAKNSDTKGSGASSAPSAPSASTPTFNPRPSRVFVPNSVKVERQRQIDQLKHRLGDIVTLFNDGEKGSTFAIYITPPASEIIPDDLTHFRAMLYIPAEYGVMPCSITIPSVADVTARNIEQNFNRHASQSKSWSLMALMNYLNTQVERLMLSSAEVEVTVESSESEQIEEENANDDAKNKLFEFKRLGDDHDHDNDTDATSAEEEDGEESGDTEALKLKLKASKGKGKDKVAPTEEASAAGEHNYLDEMPPLDLRGTALVLPGLQLSNIGFQEVQSLNLVVKCNRCKTPNDMLNLVSPPYGREPTKAHAVACSKCNAALAAAFRKDFMHANSNRAGLLDFSGCTPFELLPSSFSPTCDQCFTTLPHPFKRMEFGRVINANCQQCHLKMTMYISEYRFDLISEDSFNEATLKPKVKKHAKESLGITGGSPLPNDGACPHYKKSYRWLRFSCCGKVFACDKCHDEKADHPNERAHRMICGKCSREQNFGGVCMYCRHAFETRHSGFWEGGHGQRDKSKLSRKDPRKYSKQKGTKQSGKQSGSAKKSSSK